jgi:hypothetical protein
MSQNEPSDHTPIAFILLITLGILGIVHAVLGGGRKLFDYALTAIFLLGACFLVVAVIMGAARAPSAIAKFMKTRKTK